MLTVLGLSSSTGPTPHLGRHRGMLVTPSILLWELQTHSPWEGASHTGLPGTMWPELSWDPELCHLLFLKFLVKLG